MKFFIIFLATFTFATFATFALAYVDMSASSTTLKAAFAQQSSQFSVNLTQIK
jgi:hypothetical protein